MAEPVTGPSGGALGDPHGVITADILASFPEVARQIVTAGRRARAGHDRERWATVNWDDYRARVQPGHTAGPWSVEAIKSTGDGVSAWIEEAEALPVCPPGEYTALRHASRGLIMSDVPGEVAGMLPFLDAVAAWSQPRLLVAGLGLGIVPAWLLANTQVRRLDVIEIDPDVITLVTRGRELDITPNSWVNDPRLHIHQGDAHTWYPGKYIRLGCALHAKCAVRPNDTWQGGWFDVWDTVSASNLPSMHRLTRHFGRRVFRMWSWERPECEAMRRRGQTSGRPCLVCETGY